jgi:RNA polymerase sigma-70 factor (ECF subfamily)
MVPAVKSKCFLRDPSILAQGNQDSGESSFFEIPPIVNAAEASHQYLDRGSYQHMVPQSILSDGERCRVDVAPVLGRVFVMSNSDGASFLPLRMSSEESATVPISARVPALLENVCDESLVARVGAGDVDALGTLFERYARLTRSVALRILRDAAEAEDLVQDLFLYIQRKCGIFDSAKSSARSWIVQMAYHRALDRRRYLKSREFYAQPYFQSDGETVGKPTDESDYSAEAVFGRNGLDKIVNALSADQRETLRLHFFEGYTLQEISEKLAQPLGNVRHHFYRALDKLRKQMFTNDPQPTERCVKR